jgi:hypothetical protein
MDCDLYDFLASLPTSFLLDRQFHTDAILRAYPKYAHIPFENKSRPGTDVTSRRRQFGKALSRRLLPRLPSTLMRNGFLLPRLVAGLVNDKYAKESMWYAPTVLYLHQLETL